MATTLHGESLKKMRLDVRIRESDKQLIDLAADIMGMPASDFMRATLIEKAQTILDRQHRVTLNTQDRDVFLQALDSDAKPNEALLRAATDYKARHGE